MRDPSLLARAGQALYGPEWTGLLAADLGLNDRTMRRLKAAAAAGSAYPIAPGVWGDLARLLRARSAELASLADQLERATPGA